ncbi:MAG TPA: 4-(cytidine 5'-diphospho)-2-C-methyl-D-erythritol kinase, partial [Candidatus Omnitrophota bacterium]|nr:4-(cytidine 5'-diphospho)-2-C-methyl-D-erythritol kinase [Candidatus Omnitrophota bacterium]
MLTYRSPAKVNLFLEAVRKRPDGFHEIRTLFERVSLCDTLTFQKSSFGIELRTDSKRIPKGPSNLVYRAAELLRQETGVRRGALIRIQKRIPVQAGLGGGSSNAATTLLALNRLWRLGLPIGRLMELGARLGSDVPFFLMDTSYALGTGRGEILKKIPQRHKIWHVLIKPPFSIPTQEAYRALRPSFLTPPKADVKMLFHSIQKGPNSLLLKLLSNSLEHALGKRVVTISKIKKALIDEGALGALLSGSGSSVFGIFSLERNAQKAARVLKREHKNW